MNEEKFYKFLDKKQVTNKCILIASVLIFLAVYVKEIIL